MSQSVDSAAILRVGDTPRLSEFSTTRTSAPNQDLHRWASGSLLSIDTMISSAGRV